MPFLNGRQFDPEALRILGLAFDQVCIALQVETSDDDVRQAIANKVIEFAKAEGRPDLLCERVLEDIRRPPLEV
jgi:uncharacterized Fe-S cluster-containing MiaB family protein